MNQQKGIINAKIGQERPIFFISCEKKVGKIRENWGKSSKIWIGLTSEKLSFICLGELI